MTATTTVVASHPSAIIQTPDRRQFQLFLAPTQILDDTHQIREYGLSTILSQSSTAQEQVSADEEFEALVNSIAAQGMLQPITVEELPQGQGYRIVTGHRRLAAARRLGLAQIPCLVRGEVADDYTRALSQIAENRVRRDTDPYDEAVALKTVKVLADIRHLKQHLLSVEVAEAVALPDESYLAEAKVATANSASSPSPLSHWQRLNLFESYLKQLTHLLTQDEIAGRINNPQIVYLDKATQTYRLTDQAFAPWSQLEAACGLSKSSRAALIRLLAVPPALVERIRHNCPAPLTNAAIRARLQALVGSGLSSEKQLALVEAMLSYSSPPSTNIQIESETETLLAAESEKVAALNALEPALLERLARSLMSVQLQTLSISQAAPFGALKAEQDKPDSENSLDLFQLLSLALTHPEYPSEQLAQAYCQAFSIPLEAHLRQAETEAAEMPLADGSRAELTGLHGAAVPSFQAQNSTDGSSAPNGTNNSMGRSSGGGSSSGGRRERVEYPDSGYGEGGGGGAFGLEADLDSDGGFSLEGLPIELPPALLAELEEMGISEAGVKAIASLPTLDSQQQVVTALREHPQIAGKLRRIAKLVREEGWSLSAALDQVLGWVDGQPLETAALTETETELTLAESSQQFLYGLSQLEEALTLLATLSLTLRADTLPQELQTAFAKLKTLVAQLPA